MTKGRIAFLHGPRELRIDEVNVPDPKLNEVLVRMKAEGSAVQMWSATRENREKEGTTSPPTRPVTNGRARSRRPAMA